MFLASTALAAEDGSISPGGSTAAMRSPAIAMSRTAGRGSGASGSRTRAPRTMSVQFTLMRIEYGLIPRERFAQRLLFGRKPAEFHQAGHQQKARLGRGEVAPADEDAVRAAEALVIAAADRHHRHAGLDCGLQELRAARRGDRSVGRGTPD